MLNRSLASLAVFAVLAFCLCQAMPLHAQGIYQWSMVAQATADECFQGNVNVGLTPDQVAANFASFKNHYPAGLSPAEIASCQAMGGLPKVNQAYVWGLTRVGSNLWFSTVANTLCLVLDGFYGATPSPSQNNSWVCDLNDGEDFKPPRMFVYNSATGTLTDLTPKVLLGGGAVPLSRTFGLRSAGTFNGVVFFGGLYSPTNANPSVVLFAFNAQTQQYLGSYLFDGSDAQHPYYNNIRQWHVIANQLFTGMGQPGGGVILRWNGSLANPFSFAVVGQLLGDPAYFTEHNKNIYVSTWGANGGVSGMSLYMSPTLHGDFGLETSDAANWTEVWNLNNYEVEPTAVQGGGAIVSFGGYLYWGTMDVPGTGLAAFKNAYPGVTTDTNTFINTYRPIALFRSQGFDPAQVGTPTVDLLYGSAQLPQYDPVAGVWNMVNNNMSQAPLYGSAGFGNIFNNYTWSMEIFQGKLYVGTMDWSFLATNGNESTQIPPAIKSIAPALYGADLWSFADTNSPAVPVSINGMGNYTSYGIRNMLATDDTLWIGMANPMNLRSDPSNYPGGWKLLSFQALDTPALIDWSDPADITYGTPLNAVQLSASANLPGQLVYTPPAGTVLNAGQAQSLLVTFTPSYSGNQYSKGVSINVNPAPLAVSAANASMVYGNTLPSLTGSLTGVVNNDGITASYSTTAVASSPAGAYPITPTLNDPNSKLSNYSVTSTKGTLTIDKAGTASTLTASTQSTLLQKQVTFTAHVVSATSGKPTGSVSFMDGITSLGSAILDTTGNATFSSSTLAVGVHLITAVYAGDGNFTGSASPAIPATVQDVQFVWSGPADITYGTPLSAVQLNANANLPGQIVYTPPAGTVLNAGPAQPLSATFTPDYYSGNQYSKGVSINVNQAALAVSSANASMVYGATLPALTGSLTGVVNNDGITASYSTTAGTSSPAGAYPITPALNDPNSKLSNYSVTSTKGTLTIDKAGTASTVTASAQSTLLQKQVTFTAHVVSATSGKPTGSVSFMDGTTSLGSATLDTSGNATLSSSTLAVGVHLITVVYGGDGNFTGSTSPAIAPIVQDFQLLVGSGTLSATVQHGSTATYTFTVSPSYGNSFPNDITLTLAGLPAGTSGSITPATIAAGSGTQTVTIQVQTSGMAALNRIGLPGVTFAIAFLPLAGFVSLRRKRRGAALLLLLLCALGMLLAGAGCGGNNSTTTTPAPRTPQNYTMTVNAVSGTLQHSVTLNLTVN